MKRIEMKARQIVKEAYFDYLNAIHLSKFIEDRKYFENCSMSYFEKMDMLENLFPKTTNRDALEEKWTAMWRAQQ